MLFRDIELPRPRPLNHNRADQSPPDFSTPPPSPLAPPIAYGSHVTGLTTPANDDRDHQAERPSKRTRYASPDQVPLGFFECQKRSFTFDSQNPSQAFFTDRHPTPHSSPHSSPSTGLPDPGAPSHHVTPQASRDLEHSVDQAIRPQRRSEEASEIEDSERESSASATQVLGPEWVIGHEDEAVISDEGIMSVSDVRNLVEQNHMYVDDPGARARGYSLVQKAKAILDERRLSKMTGEEADDVLDTIQFYSTKNEKTLLVNVWQLLVKKTRFCKKKLASGEEEILSPEEEIGASRWIERTWRAEDKLWTKWDATFMSDSLPEIAETETPGLDQLLKDVPRVAKPVPDICIGFDKAAFPEELMAVLQRFRFTVTKDQWISIFALDAKGADEPIAVATNQCCRSGAAMVKRCRDFFKATNAWLSVPPSQDQGVNHAAQPTRPIRPAKSSHAQQGAVRVTYPRPDMQSFAFSAALNPEQVILYVHWAEETGPDTEVWQQTRLRDYSLHDADAVQLLHCHIDNILDWGVATRKRRVEAQCERFTKHYAMLDDGQRAAASENVKEAIEPHPIERKRVETAANKKRKTAGGDSA
ncbi:MAG: hypothetical protein LQ348_005004 [Seirophora lacunosa]|nr:MAG: hypothetical protein LQ348_005004 [Seirophora lacunosa]